MDQETVVKEKEVVHEHSDGGSGTGVIAGILIAILLVALAYFAYDRGIIGNKEQSQDDDTNSIIEINTGDSDSNTDNGGY